MKYLRYLASLALAVTSLATLAGCENTQRSMVFFTGTTLGVEIAVEPNATSPAKFIVGYKRAEGLMDPIMDDAEDSTNLARRYKIRDNAHSVLAKLEGKVSGGRNAVMGSQWFASGLAAEILAQNPATAVALVAGSGNNAANAAATAAASTSTSVDITPDANSLRKEFDDLSTKDLKSGIDKPNGETYTAKETKRFIVDRLEKIEPRKSWIQVRAEAGDALKQIVSELKTNTTP